jgi:tetratricopeptide (TPR) repeat protein
MLYYARRFDGAVAECNKSLDLDPNYPNSLWLLGVLYGQQSRFPEAVAAETKLLKVEPRWAWALGDLVTIYARAMRPTPSAQ